MPTEKPRFSITIDQELLNRINDYQHKNRMSTQTKAVLDLISKGIAQTTIEATGTTLNAQIYSQAALDVAAKYDLLDTHGRKIIDTLLALELLRIGSDPIAGKSLGRAEEQRPRGNVSASDLTQTSREPETDRQAFEAAK